MRGARPRSVRPPSVAVVIPSPAPRDTHRTRVYRAEDAWAAQLDAARLGAARATVAGSAVLLPAERRFGTLDGAAGYAGRVLGLPEVTAVFGPVAGPELRVRRGTRKAHWEPPGVVALPVPKHGEPWALRESVLLHELAHHVAAGTGRPVDHGPGFPAVLLLLVRAALGAEAELALRVAYGQERVDVGGIGVGA